MKALKTFSTNLFKLTAVPLSSYYYNKLIIIWASYGYIMKKKYFETYGAFMEKRKSFMVPF